MGITAALASALFAVLATFLSIMAHDRILARRKERVEKYLEERRQKDLEIQAYRDLADELKKISPALKEGSESFSGFMEGMAMVAKAQADTLDQLKSAVDLLQQSMSPSHDSSEYEEYATDTPAAIRAMEEQEIRDIMRRERGLSREDAQNRVHEKRIYEQMARGR